MFLLCRLPASFHQAKVKSFLFVCLEQAKELASVSLKRFEKDPKLYLDTWRAGVVLMHQRNGVVP